MLKRVAVALVAMPLALYVLLGAPPVVANSPDPTVLVTLADGASTELAQQFIGRRTGRAAFGGEQLHHHRRRYAGQHDRLVLLLRRREFAGIDFAGIRRRRLDQRLA